MKTFFSSIVVTCLLLILSLFFDKRLEIKIPIKFDLSSTPLLDVIIETEKYSFDLDWGSPFIWALRHEVLENISLKKPGPVCNFHDLSGSKYSVRGFCLPSLHIASLHLENVIGIEESQGFLKKNSKIEQSVHSKKLKKIDGTLGRDAFKGWNVLFDFPHNLLYLTHKDINVLKKSHLYLLNQQIIAAFEEHKNGTIIILDTELGQKRFLLDTGSSVSVLDNTGLFEKNIEYTKSGHYVYKCKKLGLQATNFSEHSFLVLDYNLSNYGFDGILGMDFFKKHIVFLDYANQKALISKPKQFILRK